MQALLLSHGSSINTPLIFETHFDAKLKKMRVAYIPHAADDFPEGFDADRIRNNYEHWFKYYDVIDLYENKLSDQQWRQSYDLIWVGGGLVAPLHRALFETGFNEQLVRLLESGIKYVGSSAGAMITSKTQKVCGWYPNEEEPDMAKEQGLGWIPFEIFPHYDEVAHKTLITKNSTAPMILLPDNSAVGLENGELRFYNQARILLRYFSGHPMSGKVMKGKIL